MWFWAPPFIAAPYRWILEIISQHALEISPVSIVHYAILPACITKWSHCYMEQAWKLVPVGCIPHGGSQISKAYSSQFQFLLVYLMHYSFNSNKCSNSNRTSFLSSLHCCFHENYFAQSVNWASSFFLVPKWNLKLSDSKLLWMMYRYALWD